MVQQLSRATIEHRPAWPQRVTLEQGRAYSREHTARLAAGAGVEDRVTARR